MQLEVIGNPKTKFKNRQLYLIELFRTGEKAIGNLVKTRQELEKIQKENDDFIDRNSDEEIIDESVANTARERRLKNRLWFTVIIEAILSYVAIKFFFTEILNFHLQWIPAVALGIFLTSIILEQAIGYRIDDNCNVNNSKDKFLFEARKWTYILPLVFIPALNLFIIIETPGNPLNILYSFFAIFSILLNLKTASYWKQYKLLKHSKIAKDKIKGYRKNIKQKEDIISELTFKEMPFLNDKIISQSVKLRSQYLNFPANRKPDLIIPPLFLFIINNRVFGFDAFPLSQLELTRPPTGEMNVALELWSNTIFKQHKIPGNQLNAANETRNTEQRRNTVHDAEYVNVNDAENTENDNINQEYEHNEPAEDNTEAQEAGSATKNGSGIPDNEKYV